MSNDLFIIDAKNIIRISPEYIDDTTAINMLDVTKKEEKTKKIRKNYKHEHGAAQFYKDTNYASIYYNNNKKTIRCAVCNCPVVIFSMKRHLKSQKCLNNKL